MWNKRIFIKHIIGRANYNHVLTEEIMNPGVVEMKYCIRGALDTRADELTDEINAGKLKPFASVLKANSDNPYFTLQKPITFFNQVMSCMLYPDLMKDPAIPSDAADTANEILDAFANRSLGTPTPANGSFYIRNIIAKFLKKRDGYGAHPDDIVTAHGSTLAMAKILELISLTSTDKAVGIMSPMPSYPVYTAISNIHGLYEIPYYMNEEKNWSLDIPELNRAYEEHKDKCIPRAILVINPNNPTGMVLNENTVKDIIKFAYSKRLVIVALEIYQTCIYEEKPGFHSFKKCLMKLGPPYNTSELISLWSLSKGFRGLAGLRGGIMECVNMDKKVRKHLYQFITHGKCSPSTSQSSIALHLRPPKKDSPSYKLYHEELELIMKQFKASAIEVEHALNSMTGLKCAKIQSGSFAFPSFKMPAKAIEEAKSKKIEADFMYCQDLLEETGVCILPGSGFQQKPGTYHLRICFLIKHEMFSEVLKRMKPFHEAWMTKYS